MGSIRTIKFGDISIKWNTKFSYEFLWKRDYTVSIYKQFIENKLKVNKFVDIRTAVYDLVRDNIRSKNISTMMELWYLILALRVTEIDCTEFDEDGNFKVYLLKVPDSIERCTFNNIRFHINNHCTHTYEYCKVQTISSRGRKAISYTTGEWKDEFGDGLDRKQLKKNSYIYKMQR